MKRILAAIAMLLAVVPFVGSALNETTNYYSYKKGQIVDFYANAEDEAQHAKTGTEVMIIEDKDTSDRFVKVLYTTGYVNDQLPVKVDNTTGKYGKFRDLKGANIGASNAYNLIMNMLNSDGFETGLQDAEANNYFYDFDDDTKGIDLLTLADLKAMLGDDLVKVNDTKYTINNKTIVNRDEEPRKLYDFLGDSLKVAELSQGDPRYGNIQDGVKNGMWLGDVTEDNKIWAMRYTVENNVITEISVEPIAFDRNNPIKMGYALTMYANKTADCHQEIETPKEYCYKCVEENGKFKWIITKENDERIATCEKETDASKCNPKTGSKSHLLEFSIVAALCAISLLVVRRKDLFRTI